MKCIRIPALLRSKVIKDTDQNGHNIKSALATLGSVELELKARRIRGYYVSLSLFYTLVCTLNEAQIPSRSSFSTRTQCIYTLQQLSPSHLSRLETQIKPWPEPNAQP